MRKRFVCEKSTEELERLYYDEGLTLKQMASAMGCKSDITARKVLHERGIDTNRNQRRSISTRRGMSHEEFKDFLENEYVEKKKSLNLIARELGITHAALRRYFIRYEIPLRDANVARSMISGEKNPRWRGGRSVHNGYVEVYAPGHPSARSRRYVYEHILVMEEHLGRHLTDKEVVHHVNGDKLDNRLENLQLMTISEHVKLHAALRREGG